MPDEGPVSLADAINSAVTELELGDSGDSDAPLPGVEEEVDGAGDTAEGGEAATPEDGDGGEEGEALDLDGFDELFGDDEGAVGLDPTSDEFLDTQITISTPEGPETITVREAQNGFLRQADYTRKTQELAEQRRVVKQAVEFYEEFEKDPLQFAKVLAARAQLVEGDMPEGSLESLPSTQDFEARVEEAVKERLEKSPEMQQAKLAAAREAVNATFREIESKHSVTLTDQQKTKIIQEANKAGTTNLGLVFDAMVGRLRSQRSRRSAGAARPTGGAGPEDKSVAPKKPQSVLEAIKMAEAEMSGA